MKTTYILATLALASVAFTSCSNDSTVLDLQEVEQKQKAHLRLSISTGMDVTTRAALTANDKPLTDIYILDYDKQTGALLQVLHQTSTATDFAEPDLTLDYGTHTLKVIATRATSPYVMDALGNQWTHNANALIAITGTDIPALLSQEKVSDTFAAQQDVSIAAGQQTSVSVTLQRIVAKLDLEFSDTFPQDCNTVEVSLNEYDQIDFLTLAPNTHRSATTRSIDVRSKAGKNKVGMQFFFFAPVDGMTADMTFTMTRTQGAPYSQFTLPDVPLERNKVTTISGSFYNHQQGISFSVNDTWNTEGNDINL